ncbi:SDR family oxidoreductase [Thalassovita taeanensis]|uniref:NAD(P)H dehydrogenase (Quinone) n=1 Tax=Thalassovita taeanensis TaxID=657014 RepID=A0A1H9DJL1_9RHOB|nr:SDR family oxidoreductase [Thalassovita taeanensis]SEQ13690.1 NAD(P)H dehydrogenase (quinone) [Thalassovita taeanensis]
MIAVTGATGQLGHLVIQALLKTTPPASIIAAVRRPEAAADLAALGVTVRHADYSKPETLDTAFAGVDKLLLISSSEIGQRVPQHQAVIDAAAKAGVKLLAYTSILRADKSELGLGAEHKATEAALKASGLNVVLLRHGWYSENYAGSIPMALEHGALIGSAKEGRVSAATRADYAEAAAAVLTSPEDQAGKVYELAGDTGFTMSELAAEVAHQSGKPVVYVDMPKADYEQALIGAGLPAPIAGMLADSDVGVSAGWLYDDSRTLSSLIGRPTTPIAQTVAATLSS